MGSKGIKGHAYAGTAGIGSETTELDISHCVQLSSFGIFCRHKLLWAKYPAAGNGA
jgi:hypothetical protein